MTKPSLHRAIIITTALAAASTVLGQSIGNDTCLEHGIQLGPNAKVWRLDKDFTSGIWGNSVSTLEAMRRFDSVLQSASRSFRHKVRTRVYNSTTQDCTWGGTVTQSCITAARVSDPIVDYTCYPDFPLAGGPWAHAQCNATGACWVVYCITNNVSQYVDRDGFDDGWLDWVFRHEVGHTWGMNHPMFTPADGPSVCGAPNTICEPGSVIDNNCQLPNGDNDSEIMCSGACSASIGNYHRGDARGLRKGYPFTGAAPGSGGFAYRSLFKATMGGTVASPTAPSFNSMGRSSIWKTRMDCARDLGAENDCLIVRTLKLGTGNYTQIRRLYDWTSSGWTFGGGSNIVIETAFEPDVASSPDGTVGWVVLTDVTKNYQVVLAWVDMDPNSSTYKAVNIMPLVDSNGNDVRSNMPPRIAWSDNLNEPILITTGTGHSASPDIYSLPGTFNYSAGAGGVTAVHVSGPTAIPEMISSVELDFDCSQRAFYIPSTFGIQTTDLCAIVADPISDDTVDGELKYYRFATDRFVNVPPGATFRSFEWDADWVKIDGGSIPTDNNNAVIGVTYDNDERLHIETSYRLTGAGAGKNTQSLTLTNAMSVNKQFTYKSDAQPCSTSSADGTTIPALTPYGGHSIAYCHSCGSSGTLEAIAWGNAEGGSTYCW